MWLLDHLSSWFSLISVYFYGMNTNNFEPCIKFFYAETIPQGISGAGYQALCQLYENQYHFATLYDKNRRIALYSAYILRPGVGKPNANWMIDPQLVSFKANTGMEYQKNPDQNVKNSQAVNEDYRNSGYSRGHLAPRGHQETNESKTATFTLTNIVPQRIKFNNGPWSNQENKMAGRFEDCTSEMYVITGVIPYKTSQPKINDRVTIPEYFWTAYCCPTPKAGSNQIYFPTYAAVGRNDCNSEEDIVKKNTKEGYDVKEMSLEGLEEILQDRLNMPEINLFKNKCRNE